MTRTTMGVAAVLGLGLVSLAACGGSDDPGEEALERLLENAAQQEGQDVDIEFDDDGSFSIQTEDGEFSIEADGEGNITFEGESEDGDFSINSDDGVTVIESDEGTSTFTQSSGEVPDGFPSDIPLPDNMSIDLSQTMDLGDGQTGVMVLGTAPGDWSAYGDEITAALDAAGYTQQQVTQTPTGMVFSYLKGEQSVFGNVGESGEPGVMTVSIQVGVG